MAGALKLWGDAMSSNNRKTLWNASRNHRTELPDVGGLDKGYVRTLYDIASRLIDSDELKGRKAPYEKPVKDNVNTVYFS